MIRTQRYFLIGSVRSGTTLLRLMLDHHPRIAWMGDLNYAVDCLPESGWPDMPHYVRYLRENRIFRDDNWRIDPTLSYPELMENFFEQKRADKEVVGAVVHHHFSRLLRLWPTGKFIRLLRDGRDVAKSCLVQGWYGNIWTATDRWIQAERWWDELKPRLSPGQWIEVRYENLILNPEEELGRICKFVGVEYDPAMASYADVSTYERPDGGLIYQWKRKQTREEVQLVESRIAQMLVEQGYELSGFERLEVTPAMERQLRDQCRKGRRIFRIKRYGWWLVAGEFLARRLRLEPLRRVLQLHIDEITNRVRK